MLKLRILPYIKLLDKKNVTRELCRATSTQPAVRDTKEESGKQLKDFETLTNITRKQRTKKPQKPPFVKNLLVGIFDTDILAYPELEKEDVQNIEQDAAALKKLMLQNHMRSCESMSNKTFRQNLFDYKAIGIQASQFLDARESNVTESLRLLESLSEHDLRNSIVANEQLGVQTLVRFASDELRKKYLHHLIKGESLSALCLSEDQSMDHTLFNTKATLSKDGKTMILNGQKTWVINGASADLFIVFAISKINTRDKLKEVKMTALLVEKDFPGVSIERNENCDVETATVSFNETPVPVENVIGKVHGAMDMLAPLVTEYRLSVAPMSIALTKKMLNSVSETIIQESNDKNRLLKTDAVREKIGEMATNLYAMESVTYLTSGLIDSYENQDCEMECAIAKLFCSDCAMKTSTASLNLIGTPALSNDHFARKYHNQTIPFLTLHETNDNLSIIIALLGIQHAGIALNERIKMLRNPLHYSTYTIKRIWKSRHDNNDDPQLNLRLVDYVHPSLITASLHLEYAVKRIEFITEFILSQRGPEIVNFHMELRRLAECIVDTYVMAACIGRASRAYCIGLQFGNYEMMLATTFCNYAMERVKYNVNKLHAGQYQTNDENYRLISKRFFQSKEYFPKHPLSRNF